MPCWKLHFDISYVRVLRQWLLCHSADNRQVHRDLFCKKMRPTGRPKNVVNRCFCEGCITLHRRVVYWNTATINWKSGDKESKWTILNHAIISDFHSATALVWLQGPRMCLDRWLVMLISIHIQTMQCIIKSDLNTWYLLWYKQQQTTNFASCLMCCMHVQ